MSLQPSDKKALTILAAAVAAAVVVIAVATTLLVVNTAKPEPKVSLAAGKSYTRLAPTFWCDVKLTECTPRLMSDEEIAALPVDRLPVAIGDALTVSVPSEVSDGPWILIASYATPRGVTQQDWLHLPDTTYTQTLPSTRDRVLLGIEIQPLSARVTGTGNDDIEAAINAGRGDIAARGHFAVSTVPDGFTVPASDETPAPAPATPPASDTPQAPPAETAPVA
ncbi:DUF2771 family protein [Gordonia sp. (in: high G+C Gram-positive bacteria)]|uniref:DUF2771 family protein n=1 Tax=Gordonia sp. (in: high G+C Gram-positive bacteria) TaxID=84139 RepID=UPI002626D98F|nr:DUF2771 family protein [Gordonia sp. (in: high G+C Gram-positive bacteria)]